jgi:hypothetical protein
MATRLSSRLDPSSIAVKPLDYGMGVGGGVSTSSGNRSGVEMFSPTSLFGTSPTANASGHDAGVGIDGGEGGDTGDIDIDTLLAQIASGDQGFDLDAFFAGIGVNPGTGEGAGDVGGGANGGAVMGLEDTGGMGDLLGTWNGKGAN